MLISFYDICVATVVVYTITGWILITDLVKINYGRLSQSPLKTFLHPRIAWFIFEVPNIIWILYFFMYQDMKLNLGIIAFAVHYINRDIIYPLRLKSNTPVPIQIMLSAFTFTLANGYLQCVMNSQQYQKNKLVEGVGFFIFVLGMYINIRSDNILQSVQSQTIKTQKTKKYINIDSFMFKYVSSANYLGEIIEWIGYFLMTQRLEGFLFAFSTLNILTASAIKRHRWNQNNIPNYPVDKKAVIPFLI